MSEQKIVHLRYDKYIELKEKCERLEKENGTALVRIARLNAELFKMECAVNTVIQERDCAIEDINRNANLTGSDDPYYLALGKNAQGETEYISVTIKTKDGKYKEIWRGVKR